MLPLALIGAALAAPPDSAPALVGGVSGAVTRLAASADGRLITGINGSSVVLLSTDAWTLAQAAPCNAEDAAPALTGSSSIDVWVACDDGTVRRLVWDDGAVAEDDDIAYDVSDGLPLAGLWYDEVDGYLWAVSVSSDNADQTTIFSIDPTNGDASAGFISYTGFEDGEISDGALYIAHGGSEVTRVVLSTGDATASLANIATANVGDVAASPGASIYGVDSAGYLGLYDPSFGGWTVLKSGLTQPSAVGTSLKESDSWAIITGGGAAEVFRIVDDVISEDRYLRFAVSSPISDIVVGGDGYAYGATDGGIVVLTANPWIADVAVSPESGTEGTEVTVSFTVAEDVSWAVHVGGDRSGSGSVAERGEASAGDTVTVPLTVGPDWEEGQNPLYVIATDDDGNEGHGAASVLVDNPPGAPELTAEDLGFGDGQLILAFDGISDADLARYDVYVSDAPFDPADWPVGTSGGPAGPEGVDAPIAVEAAGGDRVTVTISPLTNDQTYYVAVRAVDAGGLEGPMSDVIEGVPQETFGAAELAGETGGPACATGAVGASGWLVGLALLAARRRSASVVAVALALGLSGTASAQDDDDDRPRKDLTKTYGNFEMRYGAIQLVDEDIKSVYGETGNNLLQIEFGPQLWRVVEFDLGLGFFQELDFTVTDAGTPSTERTMMTWFPVSGDVTLRGQLLDEQILVPHVRAGLDYVFWREEWDAAGGGKDSIRGGKQGWHFGFGGGLLLDGLGKSRASLLEAQTGINDTFLMVEWRRQTVGNGEGLDFSGSMVTVGLKLDY